MFVVMKTFETAADGTAPLVEAAGTLARQSVAAEPGCRRVEVLSDPAAPGRVVLLAAFDDEAAFEEHCDTEHLRRFEDAVERLATARTAHRLKLHAAAERGEGAAA